MSPSNRGPLALGPRVPPTGIRPPRARFDGRLLAPPRIPVPPFRMPPPLPCPRMASPLTPSPAPPLPPSVFGPMRQRAPFNRPLYGTRPRGMAPMIPPPMCLRGIGPRIPLMRPWYRKLPPQMMPIMRPRFPIGNGNSKSKGQNNVKKVYKSEESELKKPWMTDDIRSEIQKKNKLYAKAKKNKDAKEWEEFKDLRNKVTRMIRDAKNEYLVKHPEQAHLYSNDEEPYDQRDENYSSSEDVESFYCEMCDRDFSSEVALTEHKKGHKLCGIDGCTFSAHPLLIERHITMQHSTGLYQRIKNVSTPEDIEKWITERKKKFPTKANVELRKAEEIEKMQRGEIIKKQLVTKRRRKKSLRSYNEKRRTLKQHDKIPNDIIEEKKTYRGLCKFSGTLSLEDEDLKTDDQSHNVIKNCSVTNVSYISDEDEEPAALPKFTVPASIIPNLVADYSSASEESDVPEEVPIKQIKLNSDITIKEAEQADTNEVISNINSITHIEESNNSQPKYSDSKMCRNKENNLSSRNPTNKVKKTTNIKKEQPYTSKLLQRLLSRSIQHERNLICQCIKYIVENNFFD